MGLLRQLLPARAVLDTRAVKRPVLTDQEKRQAWDQATADSRAIYKSPAWRKARADFLALPGNRLCACGCGRTATTVDHIKPHRGDMRLFWDRSSWQPLAWSCHQAKRGRERWQKD